MNVTISAKIIIVCSCGAELQTAWDTDHQELTVWPCRGCAGTEKTHDLRLADSAAADWDEERAG